MSKLRARSSVGREGMVSCILLCLIHLFHYSLDLFLLLLVLLLRFGTREEHAEVFNCDHNCHGAKNAKLMCSGMRYCLGWFAQSTKLSTMLRHTKCQILCNLPELITDFAESSPRTNRVSICVHDERKNNHWRELCGRGFGMWIRKSMQKRGDNRYKRVLRTSNDSNIVEISSMDVYRLMVCERLNEENASAFRTHKGLMIELTPQE